MGSPRRGDLVSTGSAFEGILRGNATIAGRFLHCGSCQKVGCRAEGRVQPAYVRNDIQKCLREHTEGVGEYQFAKSRKIISERGTAETKAGAALSVCGECRVDMFLPVG